MARQSRTLVYAPEIRILVATAENGVIDLSADATDGQVRRVTNAVSQFSCQLNNRNRKYMGVLGRMDRVVVFMKRVTWIQVFSGYLDSVPAIGLYTNTVQIRASCTLKRLQNIWWDVGLPESQAIMDQKKFLDPDDGGGDSTGKASDTGMGAMLANVLVKVGGWAEDQIKIQNIPAGFLNLAFDMETKLNNDVNVERMKKILGIVSDAIPLANNIGSDVVAAPTAANGKYTADELASIARKAGFAGEGLVIAIAIALAESGGNPKNTYPVDGVNSGKNNRGLWAIGSDATSVGLSELDAFDPVKNAKAAYNLSFSGTNWGYWKSYKENRHVPHMDAARTAANKPDAASTTKSTSLTETFITGPIQDVANAALSAMGQAPSGAQPGQTGAAGTTTINVPNFGGSPSTETLMGIFGRSNEEVQPQLVTINFQGKQVKVHKLAQQAFINVDKQITASGGSGYQIKQIGTQDWRKMKNGSSNPDQSTHSWGITMDLNWDQNGFPAAGVGPNSTDLPATWIAAFKANGFVWGGDWKSPDYMHFQWTGGGTYTGDVNQPLGGSAVLSNQEKAFQSGVFNFLYRGQNVDTRSSALFLGDRAPINDQQLLTTVQGVVTSSMRSFMSGPDGSFIAFYPDYFGINGTKIKLTLEDIELVDFRIDINDNAMATDVFVAGEVFDPFASGNNTLTQNQWLHSSGIVSVKHKEAMSMVLGVDNELDEAYKPDNIYARFGLRPLKMQYPQLGSHAMEYLQALNVFQRKWAEQYATVVQFTFMPELYPGMRVLIKSHNITVYVEEVTHTFSFQNGFATTATISSPADVNGGGIKGLGLGRL